MGQLFGTEKSYSSKIILRYSVRLLKCHHCEFYRRYSVFIEGEDTIVIAFYFLYSLKNDIKLLLNQKELAFIKMEVSLKFLIFVNAAFSLMQHFR